MRNGQRMIIGVLGLAIQPDGRMLLTKRFAPDRSEWHDKWQLPGGGMEFGESPEATLAREFQEELQVSARILYPLPIVKTKIWYGDHLDSHADTHITLMCYLVDIGDQPISVENDDETSEYGWFTYEEAMKQDFLPLTDDFLVESMSLIKEYGLLKKLDGK